MVHDEEPKVGDFVKTLTPVTLRTDGGWCTFPAGHIAIICAHHPDPNYYDLEFQDGMINGYWHRLEFILLDPGLVAAMKETHAALNLTNNGVPHGTK